MLGKSHVVGSLAVAHAGLFGYMKYAERDASSGAIKPLELFGVEIVGSIDPLSTVDYGLLALTVTMFVLWLLRIGTKKMLAGYMAVTTTLIFGFGFLAQSPDLKSYAIIAVLFTLGTLLPDIDSEKSTLGRYVPFISSVIPHRTITHTIWVVALLGGLSWYFSSVYILALTLGYLIHILEDSFSKQGIAWFYPIGGYDSFGSGATVKRGKRFKGLSYRTGGTGETVFFYAAIVVHVLCFIGIIYTGVTGA